MLYGQMASSASFTNLIGTTLFISVVQLVNSYETKTMPHLSYSAAIMNGSVGTAKQHLRGLSKIYAC